MSVSATAYKLTHREHLLTLLEPDRPVCDDCLAERAGVSPRQTVNQICRALHDAGRIQRRSNKRCTDCRQQKICSWAASIKTELLAEKPSTACPSLGKPWFWEGHVQARLVTWLQQRGWSIRRTADTAARTPGVDIIATRGEDELWVTVKGYPEKSSQTQAGHWLAGAIFDLVRYRNERKDLQLAIALPDGFRSYLSRVPKTAWLREAMPFCVYWVGPAGDVRCE